MSNVVIFRPEPKGKAAAPPHEQAGQILLFTGVRYIRDDDEAIAEPAWIALPLDQMAPGSEASTERLKA